MSISDIISQYDIKEILHFTTSKGITGILATDYLSCRNILHQDNYLEYIYQYNCPDRSRDRDWWGYVNLSVTSVNRHLFGISCGKWHSSEDCWWCVLSFKPEICNHAGVHFTTTNNMYSGVMRQQGETGLKTMFAPQIAQWHGKTIKRLHTTPSNQPTCEQAEVLYPNKLSLNNINCVYVENEENAAKFDSIKVLFNKWSAIPCTVKADLFNNR
ncbi:MAG: DarT ssDNA thymidine ADP-ribosyltransferase family protein [Desulfocapsaceae bacterium]|nr:DarT ssDNA thymidine ADP-ribosyltransferase family protein [Desulfocapsaceae bacterium]